MSSQAEFLNRIKRALAKDASGPDASSKPLWEENGHEETIEAMHIRLKHERPALLGQLCTQLSAVGGIVHCVSSAAEATAYISRLAQEKQAQSVVRWPSEILATLEVDAALQEGGVTVHIATPAGGFSDADLSDSAMTHARQLMRDLLAQADMGLSTADYVIAETGTLALSALPGQMRGVSLLPPVHVAVVNASQIVGNLDECIRLMRAKCSDAPASLSSCVAFITGPSRTGDIELTLTVGVHGPGELHLIVLDQP